MMADQTSALMSPIMQAGFAGVSAILLAVLVFGGKWIIARLLMVVERNSEVIANNTTAVQHNSELSLEALKVMSNIQQTQTAINTRCEERCKG